MKSNRCWCQWVGCAAACVLVLTLVAGCGEEKPPVNPPGTPSNPAAAPTTPAADKTYLCPQCKMTFKAAGDCAHCKVKLQEQPAAPAGPGAMTAPTNSPKVYTCLHCNQVQAAQGECSGCKMKLVETPIANPDPMTCVASGEKMDKPTYSIVNGKVYATCCSDCAKDLKANPEAVLKKATERVAKTQ